MPSPVMRMTATCTLAAARRPSMRSRRQSDICTANSNCRSTRTRAGWRRQAGANFPGYGLIGRDKARLKVAKASIQRLRGRVKDVLRKRRGVRVLAAIAALNPLLRGWTSYFRHAQVKDVVGGLDGWVRRKLRGRLWRQGKRPLARGQNADEAVDRRARVALCDQRPRALVELRGLPLERRVPEVVLHLIGLVSLVATHRRLRVHPEPPYADPHVRWCGRTAGVTPPTTRWHLSGRTRWRAPVRRAYRWGGSFGRKGDGATRVRAPFDTSGSRTPAWSRRWLHVLAVGSRTQRAGRPAWRR